MQKQFLFILLCFTGFAACKSSKKQPDVSGITVPLEIQRFERDFFGLDTNHIANQLPELNKKYPEFLPDFIQHILGLSLDNEGSKSDEAIRMFLRDYRVVEETASKIFDDFGVYEKEIKKTLQLTKHYFPAYQLPEKIITFVGPLDAIFQTGFDKSGDVITENALAIGLQLHLGGDADIYQGPAAQALFPQYVSKKFTTKTIVVNCAKNLADDLYPPVPLKTLLDHIVDKGKRMYLLDLILPETADSLKIGYSQKQLNGCLENESMIWSFLLQNDLIYNSDPLRIQSYIEEGPYTQELGEGSPGNIALFVGWRIVKKYMELHPETSPDSLLQLNSQQILQGSKYKPR